MTPIQFNTIFAVLGSPTTTIRVYTNDTQRFFEGVPTLVKDGVIMLTTTSPAAKVLIPVGAITAIEISV
jgi:hypothetical protein